MFEQTERGDANRRTLAPLEQAPRDTSPGADCELLRLCDEFRRAHARWVEYFNSFGDDTVDQAPASGELARLRSVWTEAWFDSESCRRPLGREVLQRRI